MIDNGAASVQPEVARGKRIAFVSDLEDGFQIWIAPVLKGKLAGRATRLTKEAATHWSPGPGRTADRLHRGVGRLRGSLGHAGRPQGGTAAPDGGSRGRLLVGPVRWNIVVAGSWGTEKAEPRRLNPVSGDAVALKPPEVFGNAAANGGFAVSDDGAFLVYAQDEVRGEVWTLDAKNRRF